MDYRKECGDYSKANHCGSYDYLSILYPELKKYNFVSIIDKIDIATALYHYRNWELKKAPETLPYEWIEKNREILKEFLEDNEKIEIFFNGKRIRLEKYPDFYIISDTHYNISSFIVAIE